MTSTRPSHDPVTLCGLAYVVVHTPFLNALGPKERLALAQTNRELNQELRLRGGLRAAVSELTQERFERGRPIETVRLTAGLPCPQGIFPAADLCVSPSNRFLAVNLRGAGWVHDLQRPDAPALSFASDGPVQWSPVQDLLLTQWEATLAIVAPAPQAAYQGIDVAHHALSTTESDAWLPSRCRAAWVDSGDLVITCERPGHLVGVHPGRLAKRSLWSAHPADGPVKTFLVSPSGAKIFVRTAAKSYLVATHTGSVVACAAPSNFCLPTWVDHERAIAFSTRQGATIVHASDGTLRHHIAMGIHWPLSQVAPTGRRAAGARPDFFDGRLSLAQVGWSHGATRHVGRVNGFTGVSNCYTLGDISWSSDGRRLVTYSNKRFLHLVDTDKSWESDTVLDMHSTWAWSPSGTRLATADNPCDFASPTLQVHGGEGQLLWSRPMRSRVLNIAWSEDEATLAVFLSTGACEVLNFARRCPPRPINP